MSFARIVCLTLIASSISTALAARAFAGEAPFGAFNSGQPKVSLPGLSEYAPAGKDAERSTNFRTLRVEAHLTPKGEPVDRGLTWRVFDPIVGADGKLPLLATSRGGSASFQFQPGTYIVNVAFGRASVTRKVIISATTPLSRQSFVLNAGGLVLNAVTGSDVAIPADKLRFSIYTADSDSDHEKLREQKQHLVVAKVKPDTIVRLKAGTYHVVSDYGKVNAVIGADIRVEAGKVTEATIQHRAAQLTLKLVSSRGGEAIADTAWSILTPSGDIVSESVGAFPSLVLTEGTYTAVARNKGQIYQREFTVKPGANQDVEVLLSEKVAVAGDGSRD